MRRYKPRFKFLIAALLMFGIGAATDAYLRANVGPTCFGCSTIACRIVMVADNPLVFLQHPIETIEMFWYSY